VNMLIKKGAEANLYLEDWYGRKVIIKCRLPKAYRIPALDTVIRTQRTLHEPQLIHRAKEAGVPTPTIFMIDVVDTKMIMEYVEGKQVKQVLNDLSPSERFCLCRNIGVLIGRLHNAGIIHGDLTTSNMILTSSGKVFFVDFGLGEFSTELEIRGVDLHLMKRALQSTHYKYAKECFEAVTEGYAEAVGKENTVNVLEKIREIEKRGRYISERKEEGDAESS
jgi:TP53 regulating kinase-like protein